MVSPAPRPRPKRRVFVERDPGPGISAVNEARQPPPAVNERKDFDDPEVVAFLTPTPPDTDGLIDEAARREGFDKGLLGAVAERLTTAGVPTTVADLVADIKRLK